MKNNQNIVIIGGAGYIGSVVTDFFLKKKYLKLNDSNDNFGNYIIKK